MNSSKNLLNWAATVREQLAQDVNAKDVATAEKLKKNHQELGDDIKAHEDEFEEVKELGQKLLKRNPERVEISERLDRISGEYVTLFNAWMEKQAIIQQCVELQMFNREADQIEATTSSHEAFLEYAELGGSLDDVEALMKRHDDFINTLIAQDERVKQFSEQADRLITADHYDKKNINDRRNQVVARRNTVKNLAQQRRNALLASQQFQEFSAEVDDLKGWLNDKLKTASDESYRDLSNLERKLQKHEAFESELRANEGQLRTVNKMGQSLIAQNNYRKNDVENKIKTLNDKWAQLVDLSLDKGRRLRQATSQHTYNSSIEDAKRKLEELSMNLRSTQVGTDLRSCKDLLKKHQALEAEIAQTNLRVADLVAQSLEMEQEGHFDSDSIKKSAELCKKQLEELYAPAKLRREALEESLRFHKFGFELDAELQWIKEHMPQATSETFGQNLHQAQLLHKKHKKLEAEIVGHQPMIDKTLASGQNLIDQNHPETKKVESLCQSLEESWSDLQSKAHQRAQKLDLSLKAQQYFFEAGEVESWLNERNDVLASTDYGRDRDAATKLLTKHKAIELELDTYNAIVIEMGRGAQAMITAQHPDSKAIQAKQQLLSQQMRTLQKLAAQRQQRLMESMYRHEYFAESAELERWIGEQQQAASSEDYGQDYEHLLILQEKFDDFKRRIDAGSERYNQCEELAKKLISNESPYAKDIENKQEQLSESDADSWSEAEQDVIVSQDKICKSWNQLIEQIKQRELKLHAAGEIHQFHRDVAEALSRIHEKDAALSNDLGRDLKSAQSLLRRHEGFENDLLALEAQLQLLIEDASRIQVQYPNNAAQIRQHQEIVLNAWNDLEKRSSFRRDQLLANKELQQFLTQVRDLLSWASSLRSSLSTEEKVRDLVTAYALRAEHVQIKNEIEARDDKFKDVYELGEAMIQTDHYAAQEAEEKCNQLIEERDKLHTAWAQKQNLLDQQIDLHCFLKDAKQLENISSQQEAALGNTDFSGSVDEVDSQVKKHEAFEKKLSAQDDKLINLQECAAKLISQNHYESPLIQSRLADVLERRQRVKDLCNLRRQRLDDALLYAQFIRDVAEAESLIGEKSKKLQAEANIGDKNNLEDKIKRLQKHQAFQAELSANEGRIQEIKAKGEMLLQKRHEASAEIREQMKNLLTAWRQLLLDSANRGKGLEEAQDILEFNNQLEKIDAWIRDKEMMIQANEKGKDYEHCMALQRKLDDVDSDMRVDDARIKTINQLADKLLKQGQTDAISVQQRRDAFINKWRNLQGALSNYRNTLSGALEVHLFKRDVDDTLQRLSEKAVAINTDDVGRDLTAVQSAQRKQETLERDMSAIEKKVEEHNQDGQKLVKKYPEDQEAIERKLLELSDSWFNLQELSRKRKDLLHDAYENHKFLTELRELDIWVGDCVKRMNATETPVSVNDANSQLELHKERKAEIDGRQKVFAALEIEGEKLCRKTSKPKDVNQHVTKLKDLQENLNEAWEDKKNHLTRSYQLQCFKEQADVIDAWLATKEAYLNNEDLGESTSAVEDLLRKHEDFENMLAAQWSKVTELEKFAEEIMTGHDENVAIKQRLQSVLSRTNRLKEASDARKQKLLESQQLHKFLRNVYEVESWLSQKMQVACDENYREPINLQSKIQKHAAFDSEIHANKSRIESVVKEGEELIKAKHFAGEEIESQVDYLKNEWKQLLEMSQLKRDRLNDSYHALLFSRSVDEFETWMSEIESQLKSQDLGKDLASVTNLIKRHTVLENDYVQHSENCDIISETSTQFVQNDHFMKDEIVERATVVIKRYNSLQEPMYVRHENLENSLLLHQFLRDAEDEVQWLLEREPHAGSQELGNSLTAVQSLQKKHQALEAELVSHEPIVSGLVSRAQQFNRSGHFAAQQIEAKGKELQELLAHIRDMASVRRLRLQDALESQTFYTEASEAVTWLKDKRPLIASKDYGKDEDSVQTLQRRLEGLACEMAAFQSTVAKLSKIAANLIDRQHFDALNIEAKQSEIELQFSELQRLMTQRENRLSEALKYFAFIRECDEVQEWMSEQTTIAASEDYGTDVEHIELLIQAFESFSAGLGSSEQRIVACVESGQSLLKEENPEELKIKQKIEDIKQQWDDLQELAHARQDALAGAKQVHVFDRTADETIQWIQEKESSLAVDYGQDLESIQAQTRRHEAFQTELLAVRDQVYAVDQEAKRLSATFPDAREHIEVKQEDTLQAWNELFDKAEQRAENLKQAEQLQTYFDQYRDLMAWINEMLAKITTPELAQDVPGAEALILHHNEHKAEIDARNDAFTKFYQTGSALVDDKHFLANEIEDKINILKQRKSLLEQTWSNRKRIYIENLDTQEFKRDADALENWLSIRENILNDGKFGDTIIQVEELIRKHDDFEKTIIAQEGKFHSLRRITLLEQSFKKQKEMEQAAKQAEKERIEQERIESRKRQEMQRLTDQRRQETDRRRVVSEIRDDHPRDQPPPPPATAISVGNMATRTGSNSSLTKSNSIAFMFDRNRRGSDHNSGVKRAESVKAATKTPKRTPSFTTRRRAGSFRKANDESGLPPVDIQGFLERKHALISGGKKAQVRSWKNVYSVLCGQLLCFFKNKDDFIDSKAAMPPVVIYNAKCTVADDYTKRKHTFRISCADGSEYLFSATNDKEMEEWMNKISFHAKLEPSQQLLSYDTHKLQKTYENNHEFDASSASSRTSSPDSQIRMSPVVSAPGGPTHHPHQPQYLQQQQQQQLQQQHQQQQPIIEHHVSRPPIKHPEEAPPIPPRAPVVPNRSSVDSIDSVQLRHPSVGSTYDVPQQNGAGQHQQYRHTQNAIIDYQLPPLPDTAPPMDNNRHSLSSGPKWYHDSFESTGSSDSHYQTQGNYQVPVARNENYSSSRPVSMPAEYRSASVSSTESEHQSSTQPKKNRMLSGIFSRKKKTTSQM